MPRIATERMPDRDGLLRAIGLRHAGHADIGAGLHLGHCRSGNAVAMFRVNHLHFALIAFARLDRQHRAIDGFDGTTDAQGLWQLR